MPKLSVIVPNYNHSQYLKERLDSIFHQTFQDFEVILLDDASTDDSVDILGYYSTNEKVSHFVINQENTGSPFKQWAKGLKLATGKYIWIAESDDSCEPDFLEKHLEKLAHFDVSIAQIKVINEREVTNDSMLHAFFKNKKQGTLQSTDFSYNCPLFNVSSMVFLKPDKQAVQNANFHKYQIIGDMMFYLEFFLNKQLIYNEKAISYYRQHQAGVSTIQTKDLNYYQKYFNEHCGFINYLYTDFNGITTKQRKEYITRRFNKIKNRTRKRDKLSLLYLSLYLKYRFQIHRNL